MTKVVYFSEAYPNGLEKAINDYAENNEFDVVNIELSKDFCHAMVVFKNELAEEKKEIISEMKRLEKENADLKKELQDYQFNYDNIKELTNENAELNRDKTELVNSVTELKSKVTELEKQIEKMKNCQNCKHCEITYDEETQTMYNCIFQKESECKELAE